MSKKANKEKSLTERLKEYFDSEKLDRILDMDYEGKLRGKYRGGKAKSRKHNGD